VQRDGGGAADIVAPACGVNCLAAAVAVTAAVARPHEANVEP